MSELLRTPLNKWHRENGGKMVTYAGWDMPVQYSEGLVAEHLYTRKKASLFDVSHMGEFRIAGQQAYDFLSFLSPSNLDKLSPGESCYSFFPNEKGGVVDDLLIYRFEDQTSYLICVNAANTSKVEKHLQRYSSNFNVEVVNEGPTWGQIAVQGPEAVTMVNEVFEGAQEVKRFHFDHFSFEGATCWVARTGYTGEDGFEIFVPAEKTEELWLKLLDLGAKPCGLGARDTLRLEAALNLYGHEMDEDSNPFERRMGWIVDFDKGDFLAKEELTNLKEKSSRLLTGIKVLDRAIPRAGYEIFCGDEVVGQVTSGTMSPSLSEPIAMVWIDKKASRGEKDLEIQIRKRRFPIEVVKLPFVKNF